MSIADDIQSAAQEVGRSAQAAADRVTAAIGGLRTELQAAQDEIARLIAEDTVEEADLAGVVESLNAADAIVDSIEAAPVEEPPVEPPTEEPPTP